MFSAAIKSGAAGNPTDPQFNYVTMLLHGDGTNGAQNNTFLDSSTNNFTITRNGNTTQGTFTPYGANWSNYFGGDGNFITAPYNTAFNFGTGDFCIESFVYVIDAGRTFDANKYGALVTGGLGGSVTDLWGLNIRIVGGVITECIIGVDAGTPLSVTGLSYSLNAWHHFVVCRTGTTLSVFIDGTRVGTTTFSSNVNTNSSGSVFIGRSAYGFPAQNWVIGYFSNTRIVKGSSPYNATSATLTVPTTPLTAISGTSLLTCADNRFIDDSSNAFAITLTGTPSVQRFSPFSPTSAYSTSVIGGSGYFDGSGDYLTRAFTSTTDGMYPQGTTYTIEMWVYMTSTSGIQYLWACNATNTGSFGNVAIAVVNGVPSFAVRPTTGGSQVDITTGTIQANAWTHIAASVNSGTARLFVNGIQVGSNATVSAASFTPTGTGIGRLQNGYTTGLTDYTGYMTDLRLTQGAALYTGTFTPTSSPLTTTPPSGTASMLLNYTNAGILDNAMMNDLETVGNAQISTSVKKFGTGSMYFDGTGDYIAATDSPSWDFGTGDFTLEGWIYPTTTSSTRVLWSAFSDSGDNGWSFELTSSDKLTFYAETAYRVTSTGSISANTWTHVAVSRSGSSLKLFINGTTDGTATNSTDISGSTARLTVGATPSGTVTFTGYIDELRITKGYARYTANFSVPTAAFPNN